MHEDPSRDVPALDPTPPRGPRRRWRRRLRWLLASPLVLGCGWCVFGDPSSSLVIGFPDPPNPNAHLEGHADPSRLHANLVKIRRQERGSMHRLLWRSTHLLRPCVVDKPWSDVEAALDRQALEFIERKA